MPFPRLNMPLFFSALLCAMLAGCSTQEYVKPTRGADPVDMSGNWELDYGRSDNMQARFDMMLREVRERTPRSSSGEAGRGVVSAAPGSSREAVLGLAQMAELITESQLLEVEQNRVSIRAKREGNFSLMCDYGPDAEQQNDYSVGSERCFWDGQQLVFQILLPDGLQIVHRLSVAESGQTLAILTALYSKRVSAPFTLRRIYRRYEPGRSEYRCTDTLTRGRVCSTEAQ